MKMCYYNQYVYENGVYVGIGELIEVDTISRKRDKNHERKELNVWDLAQHRMPGNPQNLFPRTFNEIIEVFGDGAGENVAVMNLSYHYGVLGMNDFEKNEDGIYICKQFRFDKDRFMNEVSKIQRLSAALTHYIGFAYEKEGKKHSFNDHKDRHSLDALLEVLSNCMDNVRASITAYSLHNGKIELKTDNYEPLNIFGAYALRIFDLYKKDMSMIDCLKCGAKTPMKNSGSRICSSCQNRIRQRKHSVRKSVEAGLSLDAALKKHAQIPVEDVKAFYNEIINENN